MPQGPNLDQKRARHAWELIEALAKKKDRHKFETQVKKFPVRVVSSGLGQALAFLVSKKSDAHPNGYAPDLVSALGDWIGDRIPASGSPGLLDRIVKGNSEFLRRATDEVLSYMLWVVRFAEAKGMTKEQEE